MTNWSHLLNPAQCEAVTAGDGPLLVLAAAGTGKTRTLTHRVAYLLENGISSHDVLLLTFTNRAAREMLDRAYDLVGPAVGGMWSGTFHHVCNRLLRIHGDRLGYNRSFVILDQNDATSLVDRCIKEIVTSPAKSLKKARVADLISRAKSQAVPISQIAPPEFLEETKLTEESLIAIYQRYHEYLMAQNMMDFDDLLINGVKLLESCPDVLARYSEQFKHVLVDEYQDTNALQSHLVDMLASKHRNIMAVGDDFQCIYSWRGADFRNIMDFKSRWPDARIIKLESNYRSQPPILTVANASILNNTDQFEKTLKPTREGGLKPILMNLRNGQEQTMAVLQFVQQKVNQGYQFKDIAVLYRSHFHAMELERALSRNHIPYQLTSGISLYEQAHIKDVIAFLRIGRGQTDYFSFSRLLSLLPGCGPKTIEKLWLKHGQYFNPTDTHSRMAFGEALPKKARDTWSKIDTLFGDDTNQPTNAGLLIKSFNQAFYAAYLKAAYENADDRLLDLDELANQLRNEESVDSFLEEVALYSNLEKDDPNKDVITLSTVHQAKGLEWPAVAIIWLNDEMFPSPKVGPDISEERRLFYVAVTRARDYLLMCSANARYLPTGATLYLRQSQFIRELPKNLLSHKYGI